MVVRHLLLALLGAAAIAVAACAEIAHRVIASWPDLDPMVAASLGPAMNDWAMRPDVASLQEDLATVAMWLLASAGAAALPPADIQVAVDHLRTFAKANC